MEHLFGARGLFARPELGHTQERGQRAAAAEVDGLPRHFQGGYNRRYAPIAASRSIGQLAGRTHYQCDRATMSGTDENTSGLLRQLLRQ